MKKLILLFSIFASVLCYSQINYQAQYTDNGTPVENQSINVEISILDLSASGAPVYVETHTVMTNSNGIFTIRIGQGNVTMGEMSLIDWETDKYISVNINGVQQGVTQIMSVPVALYSKCSEKQKLRKVLIENVDYSLDNDGYTIIHLIPEYWNKIITASYRAVDGLDVLTGEFKFGFGTGGYSFLENLNVYSSVVIFITTEDGMYKIVLV